MTEGYERYRFQDFPWLDKDFNQCMEFLKDETTRELGLFLRNKVNLQQLGQLLELSKKNGFLNALMLDDCKLGDECCDLVGKYLVGDKKLKYLFLEKNNISDKGVDILIGYLEKNDSLQSVWLGRNLMTDNGVAKFSEFIIKSNIKEFSVGGKKMHDQGAYCVARALHRNSNLTAVHLLDNAIEFEGARLLAEVSSSHENCNVLEVDSKDMSADKFSAMLKSLADEEKKKAFEEAVKNGEEGAWLRCKIMVVGQGRAGKTATVRSMLGKSFEKDLPSTVGAEISTDTHKKGEKNNENGPKAKVDLSLDAASRLAMLKLRRQRNQKNTAFNMDSMEEMVKYLKGLKDEEQARIAAQKRAGENMIPKDLQEEINQAYDASLVTNRDASLEDIDFTIWDYGGQKVFYTLHHLFLTQYGIYLLAFDMRDVVCPELKLDEEGYRKKFEKQKECREYIEFWLNSVSMHAAEAPIMIIGTFMDVVGEAGQITEVNDFIREILGTRFPQVVRNQAIRFFPISNRTAKKDISDVAKEYGGKGGINIETILDKIEEVARKQAFVNQKLSLRWIKCLDRMLAQPGDFISLDKARDIGKGCGITDVTEIENLLKFFHELGMIVHLDSTEHLKAIVTTKPQWLINELSKIIRDRHLHKHDDKKLKKAGMLKDYERVLESSIASRDWLEYCWPKERVPFLVDLMKRTMLLSEWKFGEFNKESAFLVPSLIEDEDTEAINNISERLVQFTEKERDIDKEIEEMKKAGEFDEDANADNADKPKLNFKHMFFRGRKNMRKPEELRTLGEVGAVDEEENALDSEKEEQKKPEGFFSDTDKVNGIVFDFRKSFLPNGVFQRLLCLCLLKVDTGKEFNVSPLLKRTSAEIKMGGGQTFRIYQHQKQIYCTVEKDFLSSYKVLLSMMQKLKADVMGKGLEWDVYLETINPEKKDEDGNRVFHTFQVAEEVMKSELAPWFHDGKHKAEEEVILKKVGVELEDFLADLDKF